MVREIKIENYDFQIQIFKNIIYSKRTNPIFEELPKYIMKCLLKPSGKKMHIF